MERGVKMKAWKIILGGVLFGVIAQIIHSLGAFIGMSYYTDSKFFGVWSSLMMPNGGAPGFNFFVWSIVFALITGLLVALVYGLIKNSLLGEGVVKGLYYGLILILLVSIPALMSQFLLFNLPLGLLLLWLLEGAVISLLGGMVIAAFDR